MSDLYEISQNTSVLEYCPVKVLNHVVDDGNEWDDYAMCGAALIPMVTRTIIGDDYGEFPQYGVYFDCGHTFMQMEEALKYEEYV